MAAMCVSLAQGSEWNMEKRNRTSETAKRSGSSKEEVGRPTACVWLTA